MPQASAVGAYLADAAGPVAALLAGRVTQADVCPSGASDNGLTDTEESWIIAVGVLVPSIAFVLGAFACYRRRALRKRVALRKDVEMNAAEAMEKGKLVKIRDEEVGALKGTVEVKEKEVGALKGTVKSLERQLDEFQNQLVCVVRVDAELTPDRVSGRVKSGDATPSAPPAPAGAEMAPSASAAGAAPSAPVITTNTEVASQVTPDINARTLDVTPPAPDTAHWFWQEDAGARLQSHPAHTVKQNTQFVLWDPEIADRLEESYRRPRRILPSRTTRLHISRLGRPVSTEYPRRSRGVAATRLREIATS